MVQESQKGPQYKLKADPARKNQRLTVDEKELILHMHCLGHKYNTIAEKIGCSYETIKYTIKVWAPKQDELMLRARASAADEIADKATKKGLLALKAITPDSLRHDRIEVKNAQGEVTAVHHSGPTALQAATAAGILFDKSEKMRALATDLRAGKGNTALNPGNIEELVGSVMGRIKRLTALQVDFGGDDMLAKVEDLGAKLEAEYEEVGDGDEA